MVLWSGFRVIITQAAQPSCLLLMEMTWLMTRCPVAYGSSQWNGSVVLSIHPELSFKCFHQLSLLCFISCLGWVVRKKTNQKTTKHGMKDDETRDVSQRNTMARLFPVKSLHPSPSLLNWQTEMHIPAVNSSQRAVPWMSQLFWGGKYRLATARTDSQLICQLSSKQAYVISSSIFFTLINVLSI